MTVIDTPPTIADATVDHAEDLDAIAGIIRDTERAFNTNDADLLAEHVAANATAVGVTGAALTGRDEILAAGRTLFAGALRDQYASYEIDQVRFLRSDVAIVRKLARATDAAGKPIDIDHTMSALYVLTKEAGRWWIVARQNTLISS